MQDFEKLGIFYLGREYDLEQRSPREDLLLYESKDLTTHAVCVGMTGSGKTGLCLALLEEAAIDGIPAIAIDPKGDLGNLLLAFPELQPADFEPWIDPSEAQRHGQTPAEMAQHSATRWREGLAEWGQDAARIQRFRDAVDISIYTPGSSAGLPLTVLKSFTAPTPAIRQNPEALRERVQNAVSGLLALLAIEADPLRSREHILLSNLFERAWSEGRDLELSTIIGEIQKPPFDKLGVLDLESFFPATERFGLAMMLNTLLASPSFQGWREGAPLDIQRLLYTDTGKPRLSIISIAHLSDHERMFFVTILLNEVVAWMRSQTGTTSLRALLYMDEVFGYFPPTANPPSKLPMLTLMKQARAFGLGVVLATQNPVDVDYKGLSNAGTWFLGRLQTERDKLRVLDGLEGASATAGQQLDRARMEQILSGLGNRVFLMNNVHDDGPVVFQTRWALSFLRGPISKEQIEVLMREKKAALPASSHKTSRAPVSASAAIAAATLSAGQRPLVPPGVIEVFQPLTGPVPAGSHVVYRPGLLGEAKAHFVQAKAELDLWADLHAIISLDNPLPTEVWAGAEILPETVEDLETNPVPGATFVPPPPELIQPKKYGPFGTQFKDYIYQTHRLTIYRAVELKAVSQPSENQVEFRKRLTQELHEQRDLEIEQLRQKYAPKLAQHQEQLRKAQQKLEKEKAQASQQSMQSVFTIGGSLLGALFGRKTLSASNINRATTSARALGRVASERRDAAQAGETVEVIQERLMKLEAELHEAADKIRVTADPALLELEAVEIKPRKTDITLKRVALVWIPWFVDEQGHAQPAAEEG